MKMKIKPILKLTLLTCFALSACRAQVAINKEFVVGEYRYKSEDPRYNPIDHEFDRLTVRPDGKYELITGGGKKARTDIIGSWTLWNRGDGDPELLLDHASYPIETRGGEVRLLIDEDLGEWFFKEK